MPHCILCFSGLGKFGLRDHPFYFSLLSLPLLMTSILFDLPLLTQNRKWFIKLQVRCLAWSFEGRTSWASNYYTASTSREYKNVVLNKEWTQICSLIIILICFLTILLWWNLDVLWKFLLKFQLGRLCRLIKFGTRKAPNFFRPWSVRFLLHGFYSTRPRPLGQNARYFGEPIAPNQLWSCRSW